MNALVRLFSTISTSSSRKLGLAQVKHIVAVASAKGGVGKSTTAVNLAVALATSHSLRVGLLDADIHGPSIGKMMNLRGKPEVSDTGSSKQPLLRPRENFRVKTMSMSFFMDDDKPAVLRGPMVNSAFDRMLVGTDWGYLDMLIIDMPPGTGDAQINLGQRVPLSGAVIVSTPQDIALLDARRGLEAFRMLNIPILGMVENMAHHICKNCGHKEHTFGEGGVRRAALEYNVDLLGEIPLDIGVCKRSDSGSPVVISDPTSASAQAFVHAASCLKSKLEQLSKQNGDEAIWGSGSEVYGPGRSPRVVVE